MVAAALMPAGTLLSAVTVAALTVSGALTAALHRQATEWSAAQLTPEHDPQVYQDAVALMGGYGALPAGALDAPEQSHLRRAIDGHLKEHLSDTAQEVLWVLHGDDFQGSVDELVRVARALS